MKFVAHLCLLRRYSDSIQFIYSLEPPRVFVGELKEDQPFVAFFDLEESRKPLHYYFFPILTSDGISGAILCMEEEIKIIQRGDTNDQCCAE